MKRVKLMWTSLREPREEQGSRPTFQTDCCGLEKDQIKALTEAGIEVRDGNALKTPQPEKGHFVTARSGLRPKVVDADKRVYGPEEIPEVGNGTLANVYIKPYSWNYSGRSGISGGLRAVQILELKEFGGDSDVFDKEPEFSTAGESDPF